MERRDERRNEELLAHLIETLGPYATVRDAMDYLLGLEERPRPEVSRCMAAVRVMRSEASTDGLGFGADLSGLASWGEFRAARAALPKGGWAEVLARLDGPRMFHRRWLGAGAPQGLGKGVSDE